MKRRDFFKSGLIGLSLPSFLFGKSSVKRNKKKPVIITTWNFPKANSEAINILNKYGSSMDAAEGGCRAIEADEQNNSVGIGSLPDETGRVTLDSCVMDSSGNCGSVAFLQNIVHPVSVARKVMEDTKHVMLVGKGAKQFAISKGFKHTNLLTKEARNAWMEWKKNKRDMTPHETHDTVSMLVQDHNGDMSGACTTGGWAYKMHGRVGDSPLIGAGLYVDNSNGGAAATGLGEEVIKSSGSFLVVELMRQGYNPTAACEEALNRVIKAHNGNPDFQIGYIALRKDGEVGAACLKWNFDHLVTRGGRTKLLNVKGLL
jgi:N4-(beta-N-acetylglucosaminyl)-L-asparaginase